MTRRGPRIGFFGRANTGAFAEIGRFLVFETEMRRRIPSAEVHAYAPGGPRDPWAAVAPFGITDLGEWGERRAAELAETLDFSVTGGDPTLPGIEKLSLVPDPLLLLPRAFSGDVLARRLEFVRQMEWFPREGDPLVLQGSRELTKRAEMIADAVAGAPLVLLELDPGSGEDEFLDAVELAIGRPVPRVPAEAAFLDRATVLAHARAFLGSSASGRTAAAAFGVPALELRAKVPDARSITRLLGAAREETPPPAELVAHFDDLARMAEKAWTARAEPPRLAAQLAEAERRLEAWRIAYQARNREVIAGRVRMGELLDASKRDAEVHFRKLNDELTRVRAEQQAFYAQAEKVSKDAAATREALTTARAEAEATRESLARLRADHERLESALAQSRDRIQVLGSEVERARDETAFAKAEAERRAERARTEIADLQTDLDRAQAKLEVLRSAEAELRTTQTLLFSELAEARAELGRTVKDTEPS